MWMLESQSIRGYNANLELRYLSRLLIIDLKTRRSLQARWRVLSTLNKIKAASQGLNEMIMRRTSVGSFVELRIY